MNNINMPIETTDAIIWALTKSNPDGYPITLLQTNSLVDKVQEYFTNRQIQCDPYCYDDLIPYFPLSE